MSAHKIPFLNIKKKIILKYPQKNNYGICSKGLKKEFETAVINEPSAFEPLKFYWNLMFLFSYILPSPPLYTAPFGLHHIHDKCSYFVQRF